MYITVLKIVVGRQTINISLLQFQVLNVKIWKLQVPYLYTGQVQLVLIVAG